MRRSMPVEFWSVMLNSLKNGLHPTTGGGHHEPPARGDERPTHNASRQAMATTSWLATEGMTNSAQPFDTLAWAAWPATSSFTFWPDTPRFSLTRTLNGPTGTNSSSGARKVV